jgi:peptidoglycan/xylan/chitin deacetylase (PgdA/CDA1 family)
MPRADRSDARVVIVLFHALFQNRREVVSGVCDPQQGITVEFFAQFLESLLTQGVAIRDLEEAFRDPAPGLTAVITFDDGYVNNLHAAAVLEKFRVPATFFISTRHVQEHKSFWWDAVYREGMRRHESAEVMHGRVRALKALRADQIESRLHEWFGPGALTPVSEVDRPFTPPELAEFARSPYVRLGNHTGNHAILVNYDADGIRQEIEEAQGVLAGITGTSPRSIAYPNGNFNAKVTEIAKAAGLEFGLTVRAGTNRVGRHAPMELHRVTIWSVPAAHRQAWVLSRCAGGSGQVVGP